MEGPSAKNLALLTHFVYDFGAIRRFLLTYLLPEEVVTASSVRVFKNRPDTFWKDQPVKYNFREELRTWINDLGKEDNCILRLQNTPMMMIMIKYSPAASMPKSVSNYDILMSELVSACGDATILSKFSINRRAILVVTRSSNPRQPRYNWWSAAVAVKVAVVQIVPVTENHKYYQFLTINKQGFYSNSIEQRMYSRWVHKQC